MNYKRPFSLILFLFAISMTALYANDNQKILELLDKEVLRAHQYISKQETEISRLRGNFKVATNVTDKYLSLKQLALAYSKFESDSALYYFKKCQELGKLLNNKEWYQDACVHEANICADRGDDYSAMSILRSLGTVDDIYPSLKAEYAKASLLRFMKYDSSLSKDSLLLRDSYAIWSELSPYIDKEDPYLYMYYTHYVPGYDAKKMEKVVRNLIKGYVPYSHDSAVAYYVLSLVLTKQGRMEDAFYASVQSAIADIRCANRSSTSLLNVVQLLRDYPCSVQMLSEYVKLCTDNVVNFKDMGRCIKMLQLQQKLDAVVVKKNVQRIQVLEFCLIVSLIIIVGVIVLFVVSRKRSKSREKAYQAQQKQLQELLAQDEESKLALQKYGEDQKRQFSKDKYSDSMLVKSLTIWSSMLNDSRELKKELANLLKIGMNRKAKELANKAVAHDTSFNQLFAWFDEIYLSLHPDFVESINKVLNENARFVLEENNRLSPELRIYALISMGVTDTATIASVLHYSSQTVYNYRSKMVHSTADPKFDLNKYVQELYSAG